MVFSSSARLTNRVAGKLQLASNRHQVLGELFDKLSYLKFSGGKTVLEQENRVKFDLGRTFYRETLLKKLIEGRTYTTL